MGSGGRLVNVARRVQATRPITSYRTCWCRAARNFIYFLICHELQCIRILSCGDIYYNNKDGNKYTI